MTKRISILLIAFLVILTLIYSSSPLFAATGPLPTPCPLGQAQTDFGCIPSEPVPFVEKFYSIGLWLIGFVGILFMIIGGYFVMTSKGDVAMLAKGKSFIYYAIAGLILAVVGFLFIEIIAGEILKIPGFN